MENELITKSDLQMMPLQDVKAWYDSFVEFSKSILKTDLDFGIIPGTGKPTLYKAGAEKLRFVYGLSVETECTDKVVDLDRPFIDYTYRCVIKTKNGQPLAQCEGSCNSMEAKYGYLWKPASELPGVDLSTLQSKTTGKKQSEFEFAINKSETGGQYGKPAEYWNQWKADIENGKAKKVQRKTKKGSEMAAWELDDVITVYKVINPDAIGFKNTIMKMAQKRAFVGAILIATGASEFFTQDVEDMEINGSIYSDNHFTEFEEVPATPAAPVIKEPTKAEIKKAVATLNACETYADLAAAYTALSPELKTATVALKDELKTKLAQPAVQ